MCLTFWNASCVEVVLASKRMPKTRHQTKFGIASFLYKARRPFHLTRFHHDFLNKFFVFVVCNDDEESEEEEEAEEKIDEDAPMTPKAPRTMRQPMKTRMKEMTRISKKN